MSMMSISAWGGSYTIADTNTHTTDGQGLPLYHRQFICLADTVINAMSGVDDKGTAYADLLTVLGITGVTLPANIPFILPLGINITSIDLTSGSLNLYKG